MSSAATGLTVPGLDTGGFDEHVAVNVRALFSLIQAARPALRESPVRSVVNVSSSSGTLRRAGVRSLTVSKNGEAGWHSERAGS